MEALQVRLLGDLEIRLEDRVLTPLDSARAESLLAYLLLHRETAQARERVAFQLWPDSTEAQARTNLRHLLHHLRRLVPATDHWVEVTSRTIGWRPDAPMVLDVAVFEAAMDRAERDPGDVSALVEAVEAYGGELLAGRDQDEWVQSERDRLRRRYLDGLERLVAVLGGGSEAGAAIRYAERLRQEDPLSEGTYRLLMRLYDAVGDRARAVRVYHDCAVTLERELGVRPAPETRAAYDALLPGDRGADPGRVGRAVLVGRFAERSRLTEAWRSLADGPGQVVLLTGEPGVGKTRLAEEFRAWCGDRGATTATATAYASEGALAYAPVVAWLRSPALAPRMRRLDRAALVELSRLLPELHSDVPGLPRAERLPEDEQRRRLFDAVAAAVRVSGTAVVLLADDLQWWDRESLQLLHYLVRLDLDSPMLVVATARRDGAESAAALKDLLVALRAGARLTELAIGGLGPEETRQLARRLTGGAMEPEAAAALHAQTRGNPLFVVEAVQAGWTPGSGLLTPRLRAVIESRLARLSPPARDMVDLAATLGRDFTVAVLVAASGRDEAAVVAAVDELWRQGVVREHDPPAYDFSHDAIRESAYAELSPVRRRYLHAQVARALEQEYADTLDTVSGQLARHHEEAGAVQEAVTAYARAAEVAQRMYAHSESVRLLGRALQLLRTLPETAQRATRELELSTALFAPLVASEGYASPRMREAHEHALRLARSLAVEPSSPLLRSLGLFSLTRGDFDAARELGRALRERGERGDDDVLRVEGDYLLGVTSFWAGELSEARRHLERAVATYREEHRREHLLLYAQDPEVICLTRLALTYWFLGDAEAAVHARDRGLRVAEEVGHPYTRTVSLLFASLLALDMGDLPALRSYVGKTVATMPEGAGAQAEGPVAALEAYLRVLDGDAEEGVRTIRRILAEAPEAQSAPGVRSALLRILLAACEATGDAAAGRPVAEELLALTSSVVWRPEARRLLDVFAATGQPANA